MSAAEDTIQEESFFNKRMAQLGLTNASQYTMHNYAYGRFMPGDEGFEAKSFEIFEEDNNGYIFVLGNIERAVTA